MHSQSERCTARARDAQPEREKYSQSERSTERAREAQREREEYSQSERSTARAREAQRMREKYSQSERSTSRAREAGPSREEAWAEEGGIFWLGSGSGPGYGVILGMEGGRVIPADRPSVTSRTRQ